MLACTSGVRMTLWCIHCADQRAENIAAMVTTPVMMVFQKTFMMAARVLKSSAGDDMGSVLKARQDAPQDSSAAVYRLEGTMTARVNLCPLAAPPFLHRRGLLQPFDNPHIAFDGV